MKKIITIIICLTICISAFSSCGKNGGTQSSSIANSSSSVSLTTNVSSKGNASDSSGTSNSTITTEPKSTKLRFGVSNTKTMPSFIKDLPNTITLSVLTSAKPNAKREAYQIENFKQLTGKNIVFDTRVVEWNSMADTLATLVYANKAPDIFYLDVSVGAYLVHKEIFEDLSSYIDFDDALWKETKSSPVDYLTYHKGKKIASSNKLSGALSGLFYNKTLTDKAVSQSGGSLQDPVNMFYNNKWTWDALKKFVQLITVKGANGTDVYGLSIGGGYAPYFIQTTGADIATVKNNKFNTNLDDPRVLRAYTYSQELSNISYNPVSWDYITRFTSNKIGFVQGQPYETSERSLLKMKSAGKMQFVPYPKDPQADKYYTIGLGDFAFIPKGSKNPKGAAAWYYFERYNHYNINPNSEAREISILKTDYGWTGTDYQYYTKDIDKKVTSIPRFGDRVAGFDATLFQNGMVNTSLGTPASIIASIKQSHISALEKFNLSR